MTAKKRAAPPSPLLDEAAAAMVAGAFQRMAAEGIEITASAIADDEKTPARRLVRNDKVPGPAENEGREGL